MIVLRVLHDAMDLLRHVRTEFINAGRKGPMMLYKDLCKRELEAFFGIGPRPQQRVGGIVILWAMIERQVELALWTLESERLPGGRPSTDAPRH